MTNTEINNEENENSINEILIPALKIYKNCKKIVEKYWYVFLILFIALIFYTFYKIKNREVKYTAKVAFTLYEESNSASAVPSTAGLQLANFNLSSLVSSSIDVFKLQDIAFSQKVISKILFSRCIIRGKEDYLINHYFKIIAQNSAKISNFNNLNNLTRQEFKLYNNVSGFVQKATTLSFTEGRSYNIVINSKDEEFSKVMAELYYQNLSNYYIEKATEKAFRTYSFLKERLDSLSNNVYSNEYDIASFEDRSNNLLLYTARVPQNRQIKNSEISNEVYIETLKNFETSRITLNNVTPLFQILSRPYYPLALEMDSAMIIAVINVIIFIVLVILIIASLYFYMFYYPNLKATIKENLDKIDESN
jgi:uncharacterized protein involved in exopolysaccharide biosynthesis